MHVSPTVFHQKLCQMQVALLAGQVEWRGTTACPLVHTTVMEGGRLMKPAPTTALGRMSGDSIWGTSCRLLLGLGESLVPSDQLQGRPVSYPKLTSSSGDTDRPLAPRT